MKKHILICDDDSGVLEVVNLILKDSGYHVSAVTESVTVFNFVLKHSPDIIILDIGMPQLSGDELTVKLKNDERTKHIPIIIASARDDAWELAEKAGADNFILKPYDMDELEGMINSHVSLE